MKFRAIYWWIDRWRKSTAYTDMTLEEQGAYRNLLDECALRGGALPFNERAIAKASGDAMRWKKVRKVVMERFTKHADGWHNETLDQVLSETHSRAQKQRQRRTGRRPPDQDPDPEGEIEQKGSARRAPVLVALTHETLNAGTFDSIADMAETVKTSAAKLKIPYTGDQVAAAIRSVTARRRR